MARASFKEIQAAERARLRQLEGVAAEFNRSDDWTRERWEAGDDPAAVRADLERAADDVRRRADSFATRPHPAGPLTAPGGLLRAVLTTMGRADLARRDAADRGVVMEPFVSSADALRRACNLSGEGADPWGLTRVLFSGTGAGASAAGGLDAATREATQLIVSHVWATAGRLWRSCCRQLQAPSFRACKVQIAAGNAIELEELPTMAGTPIGEPGDDWPAATWPEFDSRRDARVLSRKRVINTGLGEVNAIIASAAATWLRELDEEAATALAGATVPTSTGGFTETALYAAIAKLEEQRVGGDPVCSSRPVLVCGRSRHALARIAAPRATGDEGAPCERVIVSPAVSADFAAVVSREFLPAVVGGFGLDANGGEIAPPAVAFGDQAGPINGSVNPWAAAVILDRSDVALIEQDGAAVGVVRMTT